MTALLAALLGASVAGGLVMLVVGLRRRPEPIKRPRQKLRARWARATQRPAGAAGRRRDALLGSSVVAGILLWLLTGWVLALGIAPLAIFGLPWLLRNPDPFAMDRLSDMEQWIRNIKGLLAAGNSLESAIAASLPSAPDSIRAEVRDLVARLTARYPTEEALRLFAHDIGDATGDEVAAALIVGAKQRGHGLAGVLEGLAIDISHEVHARRAREASQARPRATARYITLITVVVIAAGMLSGSAYVAPFGTPIGQVILAILLTSYVACLIWMRSIAATKPAPRFLLAGDEDLG